MENKISRIAFSSITIEIWWLRNGKGNNDVKSHDNDGDDYVDFFAAKGGGYDDDGGPFH